MGRKPVLVELEASTPVKLEVLFAIEIVAIPKYDDCSIEVHPCRGTSGTTDRGQRTDA
jgi:hypothetical protein